MESLCERQQDVFGPLPWALLDLVDYPMILVAEGERVLHANRAARLPMGSESAEQCIKARLADGSAGLVRACLSAQKGLRTLLRVRSGAGRSSQVVAVLPVDRGSVRPVALVMFERPALCQPLSLYGFCREAGLTNAEAHVLNDLWEGNSPQQIACLRQVAVSTVRTQISQIRSKTGAQSVRAVLRQIATLPPMLEVAGGMHAA